LAQIRAKFKIKNLVLKFNVFYSERKTKNLVRMVGQMTLGGCRGVCTFACSLGSA